nr:MAG TPA: hypothetical protein [Caudoviricetes sp.]
MVKPSALAGMKMTVESILAAGGTCLRMVVGRLLEMFVELTTSLPGSQIQKT